MLSRTLFIHSRYGKVMKGLEDTLDRMNVVWKQAPIWNTMDAYEKFKPETVIFFHHNLQEWGTREVQLLESVRCHKILWDMECPWEIDYLRDFHGYFSFVFLHDKGSVNHLNEHFRTGKFIHVPHAADYNLMNLSDTVPFQYRSDLCFIGAAYPSRLKFMREVLPYLKDYRVVIGGMGWEFLSDIEGQYVPNKPIIADEYWKYYKGTKVALNLHRLTDDLPMKNTTGIHATSPNNRFFELNMMGCLQICDNVRLPELNEYYPTFLACKDAKEFITQIKAWIRDNEGRHKFAKTIQEYTLKHHSYENRLTEIISKVI